MKILITGAAGKVGTRLIQHLQNEYEIVAIDRSENLTPSTTKFYKADLTELSEIAAIFASEKPDYVIHLAAILGPACENNPDLAHKINVEATGNLAQLAIQYQVKKFVLASTSAVYKQLDLQPTSEQQNIDPQSVYGKSKLAAEQLIQHIQDKSQTQFVILRMFNIYGAEFSESLVYKLTHSQPDAPVNLIGPENFIRDYVHIQDVIQAFELAIKTDLAQEVEILNIASGIATSNAQLIETLSQVQPDIHFTVQPCSTNISWANINKAQKLLHFKPHTEILVD
jgi:nucleoside-diphosphate-sugar epimerase